MTSVRYAKFFTFTKKDWEENSKRGAKCYFFMCHKPRSKLPSNVVDFIEWGETDCKTTVRGSRGGGKICSQSWVCETRKNVKKAFYGWYDLGGVINTPIFAVRHSRYRPRFVLIRFPSVALYDATIALIPKVKLEEKYLKALATYLNSTFGHLYVEAHGRVVSVGPIAFEMSQAEKMPILDVRRLTTQQIDRLAELFDRLEHNARQVGGTNKRENLEKLKPIFHEIDEYIAEIANLPQNLVSTVEEMAETLMDRRLSGAKARPETIGGEEEPKIKPPEKKERKMKKEEPSTPLTKWMPSKD